MARLLVMLFAAALAAPAVSAQAPGNPAPTELTVYPALQNANEVSAALMREYPAQLRDAGIGGSPQVWIHVDSSGVVDDARISETSGHEALDTAALRVARVMRFKPGENRGEAVAAWVRIPIRFSVVR